MSGTPDLEEIGKRAEVRWPERLVEGPNPRQDVLDLLGYIQGLEGKQEALEAALGVAESALEVTQLKLEISEARGQQFYGALRRITAISLKQENSQESVNDILRELFKEIRDNAPLLLEEKRKTSPARTL